MNAVFISAIAVKVDFRLECFASRAPKQVLIVGVLAVFYPVRVVWLRWAFSAFFTPTGYPPCSRIEVATL